MSSACFLTATEMDTLKLGLPPPAMIDPGAPGFSKLRSRMYWPTRFIEGRLACGAASPWVSSDIFGIPLPKNTLWVANIFAVMRQAQRPELVRVAVGSRRHQDQWWLAHRSGDRTGRWRDSRSC